MNPKPSATRAMRLCASQGLSYAGPRSARLAVILHRFGRRWETRMALGRPVEPYRPFLRRLADAYLSALTSDRYPA